MREGELLTPPYDRAALHFVLATNLVAVGTGLSILKESLVFPGSEKEMLYLGAQMEFEGVLWRKMTICFQYFAMGATWSA